MEIPKTTPHTERVFSIQNEEALSKIALEVFQYQCKENLIYKAYCNTLKISPEKINSIVEIPFLPISFFKTHKVITGNFEPKAIFESSGTTTTINSRHYIKSPGFYLENAVSIFTKQFGDIGEFCILGLLPSYLERNNSSLVFMVEEFIRRSGHSKSGFYLHNTQALAATLEILERKQQKTLFIGVTYALLDFAEKYAMPLNHTIVMETGGMKGRKKEMIRNEVHAILKKTFSIDKIYAEYGMTELLSQAYSLGDGIFRCPPQMKVLVRSEDDPFDISPIGNGMINIIDLANIDSCCFIATDDVGNINKDGSFEVLGRLDHSDLRGCSLLTADANIL